MTKRGDIHATLDALRVSIHTLRPYVMNPRNGDLELIKRSLLHHGQYRPIVVRQGSNEILAGNHTYAAAMELGWEEIAVTFVDVDDQMAAKIVLVDNRSNDVAKYDNGLLAELLNSLESLDGSGYGEKDLQKLLKQVDEDTSSQLTGMEYKIVIDCEDEADQARLLQEFEAQGVRARALIA